jgi:hypothetical protein
MRLLADITEDAMVAAFLAAEIRSERFGGVLQDLLEREGLRRTLVEQPDLTSTADNHRRRRLLGIFRGVGEDRISSRASPAMFSGSGWRSRRLIVVRAGAGEPLVVLEGHLRLTAYALAPQCLPDELSVILGRSPLLPGWGCS